MKKFAAILLGVLAVGGVVLGLVFVGGPWQGRKEQADETRYLDLATISRALKCDLANAVAPPQLPQATETYCGRPFLDRVPTDPVTEEPYRYEALADGWFRLCAEFDNPEIVADGASPDDTEFSVSAGCMSATVRD